MSNLFARRGLFLIAGLCTAAGVAFSAQAIHGAFKPNETVTVLALYVGDIGSGEEEIEEFIGNEAVASYLKTNGIETDHVLSMRNLGKSSGWYGALPRYFAEHEPNRDSARLLVVTVVSLVNPMGDVETGVALIDARASNLIASRAKGRPPEVKVNWTYESAPAASDDPKEVARSMRLQLEQGLDSYVRNFKEGKSQ